MRWTARTKNVCDVNYLSFRQGWVRLQEYIFQRRPWGGAFLQCSFLLKGAQKNHLAYLLQIQFVIYCMY